MRKAQSPWQEVAIRPLTGMLDTRSRPADLLPGAYRYKLNIEAPSEGGLRRRGGFVRPFADMLYDNLGVILTNPNHPGSGVYYHNHDHHHQGAARQPITMLFESTGSDGTRRIFDGTESRISLLNPATGYWTDIATGLGAAGTRWKSSELADYVLSTNGWNEIMAHQLGTVTTASIPALMSLAVTKAKVIVTFSGFVLIMNFDQNDGSAGGPHRKSRVRWSDLNLPLQWDPSAPDSLAGYQDLDYGDEILAAAPMLGSLYIYTRRAIWKCTVGSGESTFNFLKVYSEPKNQKGCLVYPNTLVSTGSSHYYMSRESIYHYNPYLPHPERLDWLYRASGSIYSNPATKLLGVNCALPVGEFVPVKNELWFSWPSGVSTANNWSLVLQTDQRTGDLVDAGFHTFVNNRVNPEGAIICNENQDFLGVSTRDWAIKSIGNVFYRQYATLAVPNDPTADLPAGSPDTVYYNEGYYSMVRGMVPLGLADRDKRIRNVNVTDDTREELEPCILSLRIGTHYNLVDPNDTDNRRSPVWHDITPSLPLKPNYDTQTVSQMKAENLRPSLGLDFSCYERGRYLYYELTVKNADGSPAIGGDTAWSSISFDSMALTK